MQPGLTWKDLQGRRFYLSLREVATEFRATRKTLVMYGHYQIAYANDGWIQLDRGLYRQRNGQLYVSPRITNEAVLAQLKDEGFRLVVWGKAKSEYLRTGPRSWNMDLVGDLQDVFGRRIDGRAPEDW